MSEFSGQSQTSENTIVDIWMCAPRYVPGAQVPQYKLYCGTRMRLACTKALIFKYMMFPYVVFRVKKHISELKMMLMFMYCTVLYNLTIMYNDIHFFHKTVYYSNVVCCFNGFWEQETHFWTQNDAIFYLLYSVQFLL